MNSGVRVTALSGQSEAPATFRPQLTSLVDVMTILLVFLIKSFSVEGNLVTPSPDLELPFSTSTTPPKPTTAIEITRNAIMAEGSVLTLLDGLSSSDSLMIPVLFDWMRIQKEKGADSNGVSEVMIQSDKDIEFEVIKRVMYTCSKAGYEDFSVLVLEHE